MELIREEQQEDEERICKINKIPSCYYKFLQQKKNERADRYQRLGFSSPSIVQIQENEDGPIKEQESFFTESNSLYFEFKQEQLFRKYTAKSFLPDKAQIRKALHKSYLQKFNFGKNSAWKNNEVNHFSPKQNYIDKKSYIKQLQRHQEYKQFNICKILFQKITRNSNLGKSIKKDKITEQLQASKKKYKATKIQSLIKK